MPHFSPNLTIKGPKNITKTAAGTHARAHTFRLLQRDPRVEDIIRQLAEARCVIPGWAARAPEGENGGCFPALKAPEPASLPKRAASSTQGDFVQHREKKQTNSEANQILLTKPLPAA